jgi:hypothetical protein
LILSIITINKNSIAIAPTYIMMNMRAKKSKLNTNKTIEALQKVSIKNNTE